MSTPVYVGTAGFGAEDPHVVLKLQMAHSDGRLSVAGEPTKTNGQNPGWVLVTRAGTNARLTGKPHRPVPIGAFVVIYPIDIMRVAAYVAMEDDNGTVQAFGIDPSEPATLSARGEPVSTTGRHPCYLDISRDRRWLFAANYSSGSVAVLRINEDGSVGPSTDSKGMQGGESIDPALADRQEMAHCHCIVAHPGGKWVAVCDLGLSTVFIYELDTVRGSLVGAASDGRHLRLEAGAGCRHACWSHDGNRLFINNELTCTITVADFNVESGNLQERQTISCLPPGVEGTRAPHRGNSDIHLHPNGKFLYAGVRSPEPGFIAIFGVR